MTINYGKRDPGALTAASPGDTLYVPFASYNDSGDSESLSGLAVTDIEIFKNGGVTSRATDSGYSLISDTGQYGDRIGLYRCSLQLFNTSDDTGFFDAGSQYHVAIDAVTIDGKTVRFFPAVFEIGTMRANVVEVGGDTGSAANLASTYNGAGYVNGVAPATQDQLSGIANVGSAVNIAPASDGDTGNAYTLTTGSQSSGTVASVEELDGTNHEHNDAAGTLNLYYEFHIGGGVPSGVEFTGYVNGNNDDINVFGYDWVSASFKQIGTIVGKTASTNEVNAFALTVNMVGSGSDEGKVRVQFQATGLSSSTLAVDQILCQFSRGSEGYDGGAVWLDTNKSNTNTVVGVDGTARNPVSTIGAANTLLASTNLRNVHIAPGSSITFAASQENQVFEGHDWTLALGGQSISNSYITGAEVSGTGTGANAPHFVECKINEVSLPSSILRRCRLSGTTAGVTMSTDAGNYIFEQCFSGVAGSGSPKLTFGTGAQTVQFRHYSGGIQIEGMISGQTMSLEGHGQLVEGTCTAGTITIRGAYTISGITNVTLSDDARFDVGQIANATWDEADTGHSDTGTFGRLRQNVNVGKIRGDTGNAVQLGKFAAQLKADGTLDTGTGAGDVQKIDGDTGHADRFGKFASLLDNDGTMDTGAGVPLDTGRIANAVWNSLKSAHGDTGTFGEELGQGVNVEKLDGDTGAANRLGKFAENLSDLGQIDTGILDGTKAGTIDANVTDVNEVEVGGTGASGDEWGPV